MTTARPSALFRYETQGKDSFGFVLASAIAYVLKAPDGKKTRIHLTNQDSIVTPEDLNSIIEKLELALNPNLNRGSLQNEVSAVIPFLQLGSDMPGFVVARMITHLSPAVESRRNRIHLVNREILYTAEDLKPLAAKFEKSLISLGGQNRLTELEFKTK